MNVCYKETSKWIIGIKISLLPQKTTLLTFEIVQKLFFQRNCRLAFAAMNCCQTLLRLVKLT